MISNKCLDKYIKRILMTFTNIKRLINIYIYFFVVNLFIIVIGQSLEKLFVMSLLYPLSSQFSWRVFCLTFAYIFGYTIRLTILYHIIIYVNVIPILYYGLRMDHTWSGKPVVNTNFLGNDHVRKFGRDPAVFPNQRIQAR